MFAGKGGGKTSETFAWEDLKFDGSLVLHILTKKMEANDAQGNELHYS